MTAPRRALVEPSPDAGRPASTTVAISVRNLTKQFGAVRAVDDLSFDVAAGRVTGFLGPNGAGKTTTLRMLTGLITPTSGTATFAGVAYTELPRPQRQVGSVLEAGFHPGRSGRNHLRVLAATADVPPDRVEECLALVGLTEAARRPAGGYSLGMRQRLALAGALLGDPDCLLLDEPANGLDPEGIRWLRGFLRGFAATGRTVLVSSHLLSEVQATVDDIVVIGRGRLLRQAAVAELAGVAAGAVRVRVRHPEQARSVLAEHGIDTESVRDDDGDFLRVPGLQTQTVGHLLFDAGICVYELARERYDLEERFFALLEEQTP